MKSFVFVAFFWIIFLGYIPKAEILVSHNMHIVMTLVILPVYFPKWLNQFLPPATYESEGSLHSCLWFLILGPLYGACCIFWITNACISCQYGNLESRFRMSDVWLKFLSQREGRGELIGCFDLVGPRKVGKKWSIVCWTDQLKKFGIYIKLECVM